MDNTREKLIEVKEALGMCYKQGLTSECTGCTYREHNNVCMDALMEDALAVINCLEEKQATSNESKWIPVTERLPESFVDVLSYSGHKTLFAVDCVDEKGKWYSGYISECPVTHWMPLPSTEGLE
jgi:hypothetical protein